MPYIHTGMGVPKDNRVRGSINSGLILSAIKWSDCIISLRFHYRGFGSHGSYCLVMKASATAGTSLELTETPANKHLIKFYSKQLCSLLRFLSLQLLMGLDLHSIQAIFVLGSSFMIEELKLYQCSEFSFLPQAASISNCFIFSPIVEHALIRCEYTVRKKKMTLSFTYSHFLYGVQEGIVGNVGNMKKMQI